MKKLIMMAIAGIMYFNADAQVGTTIMITNHSTTCTVWVKVYADPSGLCTGNNATSVIAIPPNSQTNFDADHIPCASCSPDYILHGGDDLIGATIYNADPALCSATSYTIGDACFTGSTSASSITWKDNTSCATCGSAGSGSATWSKLTGAVQIDLDIY